jgi:hypothetical protein
MKKGTGMIWAKITEFQGTEEGTGDFFEMPALKLRQASRLRLEGNSQVLKCCGDAVLP